MGICEAASFLVLVLTIHSSIDWIFEPFHLGKSLNTCPTLWRAGTILASAPISNPRIRGSCLHVLLRLQSTNNARAHIIPPAQYTRPCPSTKTPRWHSTPLPLPPPVPSAASRTPTPLPIHPKQSQNVSIQSSLRQRHSSS